MASRTYSHESPSSSDVRDPSSAFYQGPHHGKHWYLWHPDDIGTAKPMNENKWFEVFQPLLLKVVNSGYGRQLMGIDIDLPIIQRITKSAIHCYLGEDKWLSEFRVGAKWSNVIRYRWPEFKRYAKHFYDMPNFFTMLNMNGILVPAHATSTFYPDANTESTSVDGHIGYQGLGTPLAWATVHDNDGSGTNSPDNDFKTSINCTNFQRSGDWEDFLRGFFLFDTSGMADNQVVGNAVFSFVTTQTGSAADDDTWNLVSSAPASNTALADGDYDSLGTTSFGTIESTITAHATNYHDITINATGRATVDDAGITKWGFRSEPDRADSEPADATTGTQILILSADTTGTSTDPKLVCIHYLGCG